ncbi:hypothetical protein K2173_020886 [Erythroxylum novogranatense]|uniref:RING-type E3 ubiquitin transferase n=1 Tax=Erythroxylum novogranatense TaxID=1862640 RepID=A0AAV8TM34_9ROSI|nr:hypothetical protein K2173_020886 [Erythroxylum novogranatense]
MCQKKKKALIAYVCQSGVETLLLDAGSRNGLSILFKTTDVPSNVMKWAPDFCSVYAICKRKVTNYDQATRPVPSASGRHGRKSHRGHEGLPSLDTDTSLASSGRPSTDSASFSFYEYLASGPPQDSARQSNFESSTRCSDAETCKESLAVKQKAKELEQWKKTQDKRQEPHEAREAVLMTMENAKTQCKISDYDDDELEWQKSPTDAEIDAPREAYKNEREVFSQKTELSHLALQYQSLYHIVAVLFSLYVYFSVIT